MDREPLMVPLEQEMSRISSSSRIQPQHLMVTCEQQLPSSVPSKTSCISLKYNFLTTFYPTVLTIQQLLFFGTGPQMAHCPQCHVDVVTKVDHRNGIRTWLCCLVWSPLCCIPFCIDSCKDVYHKCPMCGQILGVFKP